MRNLLKLNRRGATIVTVLAASLFLALVFYGVFSMLGNASKNTADLKNRTLAQAEATELLEAFVAHHPEQLLARLKINPVNGALPAYKFCSHINFYDRAGDKIINRDPYAAFTATSALGASELKANRFYMVRVLNLDSMTTQTALCNSPFTALAAGALTANQRLLITVGVTWQSGNSGKIEREIVSGIVAQ